MTVMPHQTICSDHEKAVSHYVCHLPVLPVNHPMVIKKPFPKLSLYLIFPPKATTSCHLLPDNISILLLTKKVAPSVLRVYCFCVHQKLRSSCSLASHWRWQPQSLKVILGKVLSSILYAQLPPLWKACKNGVRWDSHKLPSKKWCMRSAQRRARVPCVNGGSTQGITKSEQWMSVCAVGYRNGRSRRNVGHECQQQSEKAAIAVHWMLCCSPSLKIP